MPVGAAIGSVVGGVATGFMGMNAAKDAAKIQADAADRASATQLKMFQETKANLQPFTDVGKSATYSLADLYGLPSPKNPNGGQPFNPAALEAFRNSPDYQFAREEGVNALDASASSKGGLLSGNQLAEITKFGQGLATQNFGNYVSRLQDLAHMGAGTAGNTGQLAVSTGQGVANTQLAAGQAQASGVVGGFNALATGLNSGFNNYITLSRLGQQPQPNQLGGFSSGSGYSAGGGFGSMAGGNAVWGRSGAEAG